MWKMQKPIMASLICILQKLFKGAKVVINTPTYLMKLIKRCIPPSLGIKLRSMSWYIQIVSDTSNTTEPDFHKNRNSRFADMYNYKQLYDL